MGLINIYNTISASHTSIRKNGKIRDILSGYDFSRTLVIKAGNKLNPDYVVKDDDVLYVRVVPKSTAVVAVVAIVIGVVATGVAIGCAIAADQKSKAAQEEMEKQQKDADNLASKITQLPFLRGARNTTALGRTIPYVMGTMYNTPFLLGPGFYSIGGKDGCDQFWNAILIAGYNDMLIDSVNVGNTEILSNIPGDGLYPVKDGIYQEDDESGTVIGEDIYYKKSFVEIKQNGELSLDNLCEKVSTEFYNEYIKHDYGTASEDVPETIKQLAYNARKVEVCIKFDGLRRYNTDLSTWQAREVDFGFWWTNNADDENPTWHEFYLDCNNEGETPNYTWETMTDEDITAAIASGKILAQTARVGYCSPGSRSPSFYDVTVYTSTTDEVSVIRNSNITSDADLRNYTRDEAWTFKQKVYVSAGSKVIRNTNKTIRFIASHTFTPEESFGKNISVKIKRLNPKLESNSNEDAVLLYINTFCYDAVKSSSQELVPCRPIEPPFRDKTTRIGIRLVSNSNTEDSLDEINIICKGLARTWNGSQWSSAKEVTRNPASWLLEVLLSDTHLHSQYQKSEIDLQSFGALYEYCEENNFYTDGIILDGAKKKDVLEGILKTCGADLIINNEGKFEVVIDKVEETPVALLNGNSIKSMTFSKSFERKPTGVKVTYTNRESWTTVTEYFMKDGRTTYVEGEDILVEQALNYVTTHDHAYKVAQRYLRQIYLQPREIKVNVGLEGDYYPLYSTVLLQMKQLKKGLLSSEVVEYDSENNKIKIADFVQINSDERYGVIIQTVRTDGKNLFYSEVTAEEGFTKELTLTETLEIEPALGDIISVGLLDEDGEFKTITSTMKITGIETGSDRGYVLTLKDYDPELYETGTIPQYKSNLTKKKNYTPELPPLTVADVYDQMAQAAQNAVTIVTEGTTSSVPDAPVSLTCIAHEDGIELKPVMATNDLNNSIKEFKYFKGNAEGTYWVDLGVLNNYYYFPRNFSYSEFPEKSELANWRFRVIAVNIYGNESLPVESGAIHTDNYLTWIPPSITFDAVPKQDGYYLENVKFSSNDKYYGSLEYHIRIGTYMGADFQEVWLDKTTETLDSFIPYTDIPNHEQYPELSYFSSQNIRIEVQVINNVSKKKTSKLVSPITTDYKSWTPNALTGAYYPSVSVSKRQVSIAFPSQENVYGNIKYKIRVCKFGESTWYTPNLESNCYASETSYRTDDETTTALETTATFRQKLPLTGQNMQSIQVDRYDIETKEGVTSSEHTQPAREYYIFNTEGKAQFDAIYHTSSPAYSPELVADNITKTPINSHAIKSYADADNYVTRFVTAVLVDTPMPVATEYQYEIQAESVESGKTSSAIIVNVTVDANSVADLVDSSITQTKLADGCVTMDKIAAGAITADQISATDILAKGAKAGDMTAEGLQIPDSGFWVSKDKTLRYTFTNPETEQPDEYLATEGEFFVGNNPKHPVTGDDSNVNNTYLHYKKVNGIWTFFLKIQNIIMSAVATVVNGVFKVKQGNAETTPFMTVNPMTSADSDGTPARTVRVDGSVTANQFNGSLNGVANHSDALRYMGVMNPPAGRDTLPYAVTGVYDNGYPCTFGTVLNLNSNFPAQLLLGWSNQMFYRTLRDVDNPWDEWTQVIDSKNIGSQSVANANHADNADLLANNNWYQTALKGYVVTDYTEELTSDTYTFTINNDSVDIESGSVIRVTFKSALQSNTPISSVRIKFGNVTGQIKTNANYSDYGTSTAGVISHKFQGGVYSATYPYKVWDKYTTLELMYVDGFWLVQGNPTLCSYFGSNESYTVKANGLIEQWGKYDAGENDVNRTIRLPVVFLEPDYYINLTSNSTNSTFNTAQPSWVISKSVHEFTGHFDAYHDGGSDWFAKGF